MRYSTSVQLWQWYLEGKPLPVIADMASQKYKTTVSTAAVYRVIRKHRKRLHSRDIEDRRTLLLDEVGKIDRLEQEYWEGYFRSIAGSTDTSTERLTTSDVNELKNMEPDAEIDEFDDSKGNDNELDVLSEDESAIFNGWARIEQQQEEPYTFGNYGTNHKRRSSRGRHRYSFF